MAAEDARRLFAAARVARLATVDAEGRPHLVPVVFAQAADEIVMAIDHKPKKATRLKRLRNIAGRPAVCLLADAYDEDWDRLWWVRADGDARIVSPDASEEASASSASSGSSDTSDTSEASKTSDASHASDAAARGEHAAAVGLLRQKYAAYRRQPPHGPVIVVTVRRWSGWRAVPERP